MAFYSLFAFIAFLSAFVIANYRWKKRQYNPKELETMLFITLFTAILGARAWFVIFSGRNWLEILNILNMQGLAIQGGIIATIIAGYLFFNSKEKPKSTSFINVMDCLLPIILVGHSIGRLGNFFNQEVYGAASTVEQLWWVPTAILDNMLINGEYRVPLFLVEMILNLTLFAIILLVVEKIFKGIQGISAAAYLFGYGMIRMILENFRDPIDIISLGPIRVSVVTAIAFIIAAGYIFMKYSLPQLQERKLGIKKEKIEKEIKENKRDEGQIG